MKTKINITERLAEREDAVTIELAKSFINLCEGKTFHEIERACFTAMEIAKHNTKL